MPIYFGRGFKVIEGQTLKLTSEIAFQKAEKILINSFVQN